MDCKKSHCIKKYHVLNAIIIINKGRNETSSCLKHL